MAQQLYIQTFVACWHPLFMVGGKRGVPTKSPILQLGKITLISSQIIEEVCPPQSILLLIFPTVIITKTKQPNFKLKSMNVCTCSDTLMMEGEEFHSSELLVHCRVCGSSLLKQRVTYPCLAHQNRLLASTWVLMSPMYTPSASATDVLLQWSEKASSPHLSPSIGSPTLILHAE